MISPIMYFILSFVPAGILSLVFEVWSRFSNARGARSPIHDKLLRPPGETCRRKMLELDDKIGELSIWIIGFPATLLLCYLSSSGTTSGARSLLWILALVFALAVLAVLLGKMVALIKERDNWRLGFSAERAVGEQVNQLMAEGCRVFHDFPLEGNGNIDHIVVAATGVFAIETRAKRKVAASDTQQAHEVIYDGKTLEYPLQSENRDLDVARQLAARLEKFLAPYLSEPVPIQPILTLPGWYVISRALGDVIVVNPRMIDIAILSPSQNPLPPERIREISQLIDEKCRDVAF